MAVKRRVIWMDDREWRWMQEEAAKQGMTVSAYIRAAIMLAPPIDEGTKTLVAPDAIEAGTQAFSRFVATADRFNTQPFRGPIPKRK